MKSIGLVIPTLHKGGAERVASLLSKGFSQAGFDVHIILFENKVSYPYSGEMHVIDVPIGERWLEPWRVFKRGRALKNLAREFGIDLFISFDEIASLSALASGVKTIVTIHKSLKEADKLKGPLLRILSSFARSFYKDALCIVSPSKSLTEELKSLFKGRSFFTIPNPIDVDEALKLAKEDMEIDVGDFDVLNIGRASSQKGQWHLLDILRIAKVKGLMLAPPGELSKMLEEKKPDNVKIVKTWVKNVFPYYREAQLYLSTSYFEGFSLTLVEAMSVGTPSISTDCPHGPAEVLGEEKEEIRKGFVLRECGITGPVFPREGLEKEYAEVLEWALKNDLKDELGRNCIKRAREHFSFDSVLKKWVELVDSFL